MPFIPRVPGVPGLTSYAAVAVQLLTRDVIQALGIGLGLLPRWGIFFQGFPVIWADNQVSFEFRKDFTISNYPTEAGGFQSYNKVELPGDIRCRFSTGGSEFDRQRLLTSIDQVLATIDLYDVVTPEKVYLNYTFTHVDYNRKSSNVGLLTVDLWLTEVRPSTQGSTPSPQNPTLSGQQGLGAVQARAPTSAFTASFPTDI